MAKINFTDKLAEKISKDIEDIPTQQEQHQYETEVKDEQTKHHKKDKYGYTYVKADVRNDIVKAMRRKKYLEMESFKNQVNIALANYLGIKWQ